MELYVPHTKADRTRQRIIDYFKTHIGANQTECARALGLTAKTVHLYMNEIRAEWRERA